MLNVNDPVAMHLLVETAIADSANYDILAYEELEELKKELQMSTSRLSALKRKLILETKLQEAASSLNRLPSSGGSSVEDSRPDSSSSSAKYDESSIGPGRSRKSTNTEPANTSNKAREITEKITREEAENLRLRQRLLEHTAGVLQLTYNGDGLQNSRANHYGGSSLDNHRHRHRLGGNMTPESMANDFNEGSLYKEADILDVASIDHEDRPDDASDDSSEDAISHGTIKDTEERLRALSHSIHEVLHESGVGSGLLTPPEDTANIDSHLSYLEKSIKSIPKSDGIGAGAGIGALSGPSEQIITSTNTRINEILNNATSSPAVKQRELSSNQPATDLNFTLEQLERHVANLSEQKAILTRQIQQQRELNEKSDAEKDEFIADLQEEIAMFENELEVAKGEVNAAQERIAQFEEEIETQARIIKAHQEKETQNTRENPQDPSNAAEGDNNKSNEPEGPSNISKHIEELEAIRSELVLQKEAAEKLQNELDAKEFESDTHREARISLEEQITLKEEEITQHKQALDEFVRQSIDTQNEMDRLTAENAMMHKELIDKAEQLAACVEKLERLTPELANKIDSSENSEDQLAKDEELRDLRESIEDSERQLTHKEAGLKAYSEKLTELERAIMEHEQALATAEELAMASKAEIEALRQARTTAETTLTDVQQEVIALRTQLDHLNQCLISKDREIEELRTQSEQIADQATSEEMEVLRARLAESDAKISQLEAEVSAAGPMISTARSNPIKRRTDTGGEDSTLSRAREVIDFSSTILASDSVSTTDLRQHIQMMESELRDTIGDHEELVKASIEFEREREHLDKMIDQLREKCDKLEAQLNEKQLEEITTGEGGEHAALKQQISIRVLKEEFKRIMRESRQENLRILKLEQEERKRLEILIQSLRRGSQPQIYRLVPDSEDQNSGVMVGLTQR